MLMNSNEPTNKNNEPNQPVNHNEPGERSKLPFELDDAEFEEVRRFAARKHTHAQLLDDAIHQALREWLWLDMKKEIKPDVVKKVLPLIHTGRKLDLKEADAAEDDSESCSDQCKRIARKIFGDSPVPVNFQRPPVSARGR
jgi:hypothetical protein